jgi:hypothetical protein
MAEVRLIRIDAKNFQEQLGKLAATMAEKIYREGQQHIPGPEFVKDDLTTLLRYAASVYNLLNYLNAVTVTGWPRLQARRLRRKPDPAR